MKRRKYVIILLVVLASALTLLAATQQWSTLTFGTAESGSKSLPVGGQVAAPALSALGFAGLALSAALAIAGRIIRVILGVLGVAVGASIVYASAVALSDPVAAGASVVTAATGLSGPQSVHDLVSSVDETAWPIVAIVAGVLLVVAAIAVLVTGGSWPSSSRRYQAVRLENADAADSPVDDWDELSGGDDPTR